MSRGSAWRLALLALLWGSSFLWIKIALRGLSPLQITLVRLALGAAVLLVIVGLRRLSLPRDLSTWAHLTVAALLANALPYWLFAVGEEHVASSLAGAMNATTPLWTLAVALTIRSERRPSLGRVAGLLLGFLGALIILKPWAGTTGTVGGALTCLAAAASYGVSYVYMSRYLTGRGVSPLVLSATQLTAATGLLVLATAAAGRQPINLTWDVGGAMLVLGVAGTGVAYVLNYRLISDDGPTAASVVTYLLPVVAVGLGTVALQEPADWNILLGTLVVLTGVALTQVCRVATNRTPPAA